MKYKNDIRILIVDDNRDAADTLAMLINIEGHEVFVAYDADSGFRMAALNHPHLIFHDIQMPGTDGYAAARKLRSDPLCSKAVLVALTAFDAAHDRRRASEAGFDLHMPKPASFDDIRMVLEQASARAGPASHE